MRAQAKKQLDEVPAFDELHEEHVWSLDVPDHRSRGGRDDEGLGLRALADSPEWLSRSYWRRLRAA
jgi:hypothetical protein